MERLVQNLTEVRRIGNQPQCSARSSKGANMDLYDLPHDQSAPDFRCKYARSLLIACLSPGNFSLFGV